MTNIGDGIDGIAPVFVRISQASTIVLDLRNGSTMRINDFSSIRYYAFLFQKISNQKLCLNNINQLLRDCITLSEKRFQEISFKPLTYYRHC